MAERPTLSTERLRLRPLTLADARRVCEIAGDDAVADTVPVLPHPYELHHAEDWIGRHQAWFDEWAALELGIELRSGPELIGSTGLSFDRERAQADLGFLIGRAYWGHGYATEAARAMVRYGFETFGLDRIHAHHLTRNAASGAVLEKVGLREERGSRGHVRHRGRLEEVTFYGMRREAWERSL